MHSPSRFLTLLILCAAALAGGCDDSNSDATDALSTLPDSTTADTNTPDELSPDTNDTEYNSPFSCDVYDILRDADGDGILNSIEIAAGYDPCNPNTDGDCFCDGPITIDHVCIAGEDLNANGIHEPQFGESSALNGDENGDSIPDGCYNLNQGCGGVKGLVCNGATYNATQAKPARSARTNLALPVSFSIAEHEAAQASSFSDPTAGIYGYVIKRTANQDLADIFQSFEQALATANQNRLNTSQNIITSWLGKELNFPQNLLQSRGEFLYGAGTNNPTITTQDPAALRDLILSQLSGVAVTTTGVSGTPCTNIINHHIEEHRDGNTLITLGLLACASDYQQPDTKLFFDDFLSGTQHAIAEETIAYAPENIGCECTSGIEGGGLVDFLWVIDNSGSMSDAQENVAAIAGEFMDLLLSTSVDWRLGVTTTDAYLLGLDPEDPALTDAQRDGLTRLQQEPMREKCTGLRGLNGFLNSATPDVRGKFEDLVTQDASCALPTSAPGANLCGADIESGLLSAQFVINQLLDTNLGPDCPSGEAYQLRRGADQKTVLIWVTDEEDLAFKILPTDGSPETILAADDPARIEKMTQFQDAFDALTDDGLPITLHAIVGDRGLAQGGVCAPFTSDDSATSGAQYGQSYTELALASGGLTASICADDLSTPIIEIIRQTIGTTSSYPLQEDVRPIASSIRVAIGDKIISRIDNGTDPYWEYVADTNAIAFFRTTINRNESIAIAYKAWAWIQP